MAREQVRSVVGIGIDSPPESGSARRRQRLGPTRASCCAERGGLAPNWPFHPVCSLRRRHLVDGDDRHDSWVAVRGKHRHGEA